MTQKQFYPASTVDELAHLFEQSTHQPLTFGGIITLEGEVNAEVLGTALNAALDLYPKLQCVLVNRYPSVKRWFRFAWEYHPTGSEEIMEEIEDLEPNPTTKDVMHYFRQYHPLLSLDITRQTPLKVMLIRNPGCTHLIIYVHHAATDGLGLIFFIQTLIQTYEDIFYQKKKRLTDAVDYSAISKPDIRFRLQHLSPKHLFPFLKYNSLAKKEPPLPLYPREDDEGTRVFVPLYREISPHQFTHVKTTAKRHGVTINTYLLASMFQTIKKWNQQWSSKPERIYISVPLNLRTPAEQTVANMVSGFYLPCRSELIDGKAQLLKMIQKEQKSAMELARQSVNLTSLLNLLPLPMKKRMFKNRASSVGPTITLSNMGMCQPNPHHTDKEGFHYMGPARIVNIGIIPHPVQWPQLGILSYNNKLSIGFGVFRSHFPAETAEKFLQLFIEELMAEE